MRDQEAQRSGRLIGGREHDRRLAGRRAGVLECSEDMVLDRRARRVGAVPHELDADRAGRAGRGDQRREVARVACGDPDDRDRAAESAGLTREALARAHANRPRVRASGVSE